MDPETSGGRGPRRHLSDQHAGLLLGVLVCVVLLFVGLMVVFVFREAWASFSHNGFAWFGGGGNVDKEIQAIFTSAELNETPVYTFHAWPIIWGTLLVTGGAVLLSFVCALYVSVFIVEFAPEWMRSVLEPVVRLLASVPSVIYGLVGVLVVVPFISRHVIADGDRRSVSYIVSLSGYSLLAGVLILTVMIAPLMIAVFVDGLRVVPRNWLEGSLALGVNRWRTFWKVGVRTARPALVAGTVLATARGLGEAVMLAMVTGGVGWAPNPADGLIFFVEPTRPLAATILQTSEELTAAPMRHTIFAIAAVLLFSAAMLSLAGWAAKQPMKRYGVRA
jgi:ABC-type phosphate transport system permease subunit